ncbi:YdcF family protein [Niabella hirudinis]|uniref:YdcF family protein n=1 Tax=Niabella hirudinis TaxID=1285929 RepID=UPI003EBFA38E
MVQRIIAALGILLVMVSLNGCVSYRKRPTRLYEEVLSKKMTFDAGIVPGVPFQNGKWDTVMKGRVIWAVQLYNQGIIRNIIFSGGAVYSPYYEARIMGLYAQQLGIPETHIFYETRAEHSTENVFYSYQIARQEGFKSIALVTDPFQSSMIKGFTRRRFGTPVIHIPFMVDTLKKYNHIDLIIDPAPAYVQPFRSILDREGFFRRFRGTLGAFIPWEGKGRRKARAL